jgi:hypothetical protein
MALAVTQDIRLEQLQALEAALESLVKALRRTDQYVGAIPALESCKRASLALRKDGFDQGKLNELARSVPQLFWLYKEWMPPLVEVAPHCWEEPPWFKELAPLEQKLQELAFGLRVVGEY